MRKGNTITQQFKLEQSDDTFWRRTFFADVRGAQTFRRKKKDLTGTHRVTIGEYGELWLTDLFEGRQTSQSENDKICIYKKGVIVHEIPISQLGKETVIGRHSDCDLQLESFKLAMYHAVILNLDGQFYIESLDIDNGTLVDRKKLKFKTPVQIGDGMLVDLPGYRLAFTLSNAPALELSLDETTEELDNIPEFFYKPPPPPPSPLLSHLVGNQTRLEVWNEDITQLKVVDIIEETHDCKTFRMAALEPILFSYKPGQFITFHLNIDDQEVKRSYSMSSSPSRPHLLEVSVKRVPGVLVSNWFCDHVKLGDTLTAKGPQGKFTCFDFPSNKILFIGAGSGITPIISMIRWIIDTAADVDVKVLGSFKTPEDIIFNKEFEMLSARKSGFQTAVTVTSDLQGVEPWTGFTGRINEDMLNEFAPDLLERDIFMCGPDPFANSIKEILYRKNFDMACFHTESFGSGRSGQDTAVGGETLGLKGTQHQVTFAKSGLVVQTDENIDLLTLAEAHGIELDYSCRVGSCGECEVKCKGQVEMNEHCEIDAKTKAAGFVYTCCCRAKTDLVLEA